MSKIVVYQKTTCTTCREVYSILKEAHVDFDAVDYYIDPIPKRKLKDLLKKMGMQAHELLRRNEPLFKELHLIDSSHTEEELIDLMIKHPDLIQRPIVEKGSKAIVARPAARIKEIL